MNAKADWGEVLVEVLNEGGQPLPGGNVSAPVAADGVRLPVTWPGRGIPGDDTPWPVDRPVRLRFSLRNARLYAWGYGAALDETYR